MIKRYLEDLIIEKGRHMDDPLVIDGHFGLTYRDLVTYIASAPKVMQAQIRDTLVKIDFRNGDVFHYLNHLGRGMVQACMAVANG